MDDKCQEAWQHGGGPQLGEANGLCGGQLREAEGGVADAEEGSELGRGAFDAEPDAKADAGF